MDATLALPVLIFLIAVALLFDFLNGLHDAANSIATIVVDVGAAPQYAVLWAAFFNFIAFVVFGLHVANTIGTGIIEPSVVDATVIFAALVGAISAGCRQLLSENDCRHGGVSPLFFPSLIQDQPGIPVYPGVPRDDLRTERRVVVGGPPSASP